MSSRSGKRKKKRKDVFISILFFASQEGGKLE